MSCPHPNYRVARTWRDMCHLPPKLQGLKGWVHRSALRGSNRAGVQVLCVTPPKSQGPMELGVHDFPCPKLNGSGSTRLGVSLCPPSPPQQTQLLLHWGVRRGSHPQPRVGVPGYPARGGFEGGSLTRGLIVVDTDAFKLQVRVPHVVAAGVDAVFVADHLPELGRTGSSAGREALEPPQNPGRGTGHRDPPIPRQGWVGQDALGYPKHRNPQAGRGGGHRDLPNTQNPEQGRTYQDSSNPGTRLSGAGTGGSPNTQNPEQGGGTPKPRAGLSRAGGTGTPEGRAGRGAGAVRGADGQRRGAGGAGRGGALCPPGAAAAERGRGAGLPLSAARLRRGGRSGAAPPLPWRRSGCRIAPPGCGRSPSWCGRAGAERDGSGLGPGAERHRSGAAPGARGAARPPPHPL